MPCLHPITRDIFDYRLQKIVSIKVPCGKCISCRKAFRRGWEFRIRKTAEASKGGFIYDTLTIRDEAMPHLDYSEVSQDGALFLPGEYFGDGINRIREVSNECLSLLEHYDFKLPYFPRTFVSHWIKKARERYKKSTGKRLKLRYVIVQEYGPKFSRSHFHCMFFDISYEDYIKYFAEPWRAQYGFTKTKWINSTKDAGCVASYLTKYFTKGDFESPLVKSGFLPKPWRLISHGVGSEYLSESRCNIAGFLGLPGNLLRLAMDTSVDNKDQILVQNLCSMVDNALCDLEDADLFRLMDVANTAYLGVYPLSLPRYYKDKLFKSNTKSCFYEILAHHIRSYGNSRRFKELCEFVALQTAKPVDEVSPGFEDGILSYPYWNLRFDSFQRSKALLNAKASRRIEANVFSRFLRAPKQDSLCL